MKKDGNDPKNTGSNQEPEITDFPEQTTFNPDDMRG